MPMLRNVADPVPALDTQVRENSAHTRSWHHISDYTVNFYNLFSVDTAHVLPRPHRRRVKPQC